MGKRKLEQACDCSVYSCGCDNLGALTGTKSNQVQSDGGDFPQHPWSRVKYELSIVDAGIKFGPSRKARADLCSGKLFESSNFDAARHRENFAGDEGLRPSFSPWAFL
jgi:hypothetical protein